MILPLHLILGFWFAGNAFFMLLIQHAWLYLSLFILISAYLLIQISHPKWMLLSLCCLILSLSYSQYQFSKAQINPWPQSPSIQKILLRVDSDPETHNTQLKFEARTYTVNGVALSTRVLCHVKEASPIQFGDWIEITQAQKMDFGNKNPWSDIHQILFIKKLTQAQSLKFKVSESGIWILRTAYHCKHLFLKQISKHLPEPFDALLAGLLIGSSSAPLPENWSNAYRKVGVIHLLVVSGAQVALLLGTLQKLLFFLPAWPRLILISVFNFGFAFATGADPSIMRAAWMAEIALLQDITVTPKNKISLLMLSAWVLSLWHPEWLWSISFQLSFAATFALMFVSPILEQVFKKKLPEFWAGLFANMLGPTLITSPIVIYYFSTFSWLSLPLNLILPPLVEILVLGGFVCTLLSFVLNAISHLLFQALFIPLILLQSGVSFFAQIPGMNLYLLQPSMASLVLYFFLLWVGLMIPNHKSLLFQAKNFAYFTGVVILLLAWHTLAVFSAEWGQLQISAIDVGQGDSILIETPEKKRILIDAGPIAKGMDAGKKKVLPYLQKRAVSHLDLVIISHAHLDHFGGLISVLSEIPADKVIYPGLDAGPAFEKLKKFLKQKHIPLESVQSGDEIFLDTQVSLNVWMPVKPWLKDNDLNENSVMVFLKYKEFESLFTGDAGVEAEEKLLNHLPSMNIEVLKIGHHGSRFSSSSAFLQQLHPKLALISCGQKNRYKHPHIETLARLKKLQIPYYRTDQEGSIRISSDGYEMKVDLGQK